MNYSEMTDFEIDAAVAALIHPGLKVTNFAGEAVVWFGNLETRIVRYCNSWADAGPIIQKSKIDINWAMQRGNVRQPYARNSAPGASGNAGYIHDNPLRAAMIVFLMMQEAANVS